jgi:hypothetical protein
LAKEERVSPDPAPVLAFGNVVYRVRGFSARYKFGFPDLFFIAFFIIAGDCGRYFMPLWKQNFTSDPFSGFVPFLYDALTARCDCFYQF